MSRQRGETERKRGEKIVENIVGFADFSTLLNRYAHNSIY
jgi:hypothetical protein